MKDASDKKILVDMLFWAVDNPAPANYLLISGDRDFSNCLHQLRMRRYNILLAQPQQASAPLTAAAKTVWLWTSLAAGGPPVTSGESSQLANVSSKCVAITSQSRYPEPIQLSSESLSLGTPNSNANIRVGDTISNGKYFHNALNQPAISRTLSSGVIQETKSNSYTYQPEFTQTKQFKKAPHEFFRGGGSAVTATMSAPNFFPGNSDPAGNNGSSTISGGQNPYSQFVRPNNSMQIHASPHGNFSMNPKPDGIRPLASFTNTPDIGKLGISERQVAPNFHRQAVEELKTGSLDSHNLGTLNAPNKGHLTHNNQMNKWHPRGPGFPLLPSSPVVGNTTFSTDIWGAQGRPSPSDYVQGLIGIILLALDTLKAEKVMPTEANITDCIRFGELKHQNTDVRKALDSAIEQNMVVEQRLGTLQLYVGKNERLWKCVNTTGGNPNQYPKGTWDQIQKFLTSSAGRSAILASHCR